MVNFKFFGLVFILLFNWKGVYYFNFNIFVDVIYVIVMRGLLLFCNFDKRLLSEYSIVKVGLCVDVSYELLYCCMLDDIWK